MPLQMKQESTTDKGKSCEETALQFFQRQGYQLISKNQRLMGVEIDLILKNSGGYLLVEVKSDNSWRREHPMSLNQKKRLKLAFTDFCALHKEPVQIKLALVDEHQNVHTFPLEFS